MTAVSLVPAAGKARAGHRRHAARWTSRTSCSPLPTGWCSTWSAPRWRTPPEPVYDGVERGGVLNLRYSQFRPDVVRIVLDLDGPKAYKVEREGETSPGHLRRRRRRSWPGRRPSAPRGRWSKPRRRAAAGHGARRSGSIPLGRAAAVGRGRGAPHHRHLGPRQHRRRGRRASPPSAAGPSSWARTSRVRSPPRSRTSPGRRPSRRSSRARASPPRRCRAASSGSTRRRVLAALDSLEPLETSVVRVNYAQAGALAQDGREHPDQEPRPGRAPTPASNSLIITDTRSRARQRRRLRARARHPDAAALDPGQDHLRRPDRPRAARRQVRPG